MGKIVLIEWDDAASRSGGWHYLDDEDTVMSSISIGIVCSEDDKQVVLALSKNEKGLYAETFSIPKGCIKRIRTLKVGRK